MLTQKNRAGDQNGQAERDEASDRDPRERVHMAAAEDPVAQK